MGYLDRHRVWCRAKASMAAQRTSWCVCIVDDMWINLRTLDARMILRGNSWKEEIVIKGLSNPTNADRDGKRYTINSAEAAVGLLDLECTDVRVMPTQDDTRA